MSPRRRCLECSALAEPGQSRCATHKAAREATRGRARAPQHAATYNSQWKRYSKQQREQWLATNGAVCPGYGPTHPPHPTPPDTLVVDHDLGVMCRVANAIKAATTDKARRAGAPPRRA